MRTRAARSSWLRPLLTCALVLLTSGCSSPDAAPKPLGSSRPKSADYPYSLKIYRNTAKGAELVQVPPRGWPSAAVDPSTGARLVPQNAPGGSGSEPIAQKQAELLIEEELPDGTKQVVDTNFGPVTPNDWILSLAGYMCEAEALEQDSDYSLVDPIFVRSTPNETTASGLYPAWSISFGGGFRGQHWFIYGTGRGSTCDDVLARQEHMLCMADKLAQISDTIAPLQWDVNTVLLDDRFTVPPQATRDKFIARDEAIMTLAHLALLETENRHVFDIDTQRHTLPVGPSCTGQLTQLATDPQNFFDPSSIVRTVTFSGGSIETGIFRDVQGSYFGGGAFSPSDPETWRSMAVERLKRKTHIMRAAGRLLKDLLDKSLDADLAGAEHKRSSALDPMLGTALMWGARGGDDGPYNSLRHAIRMLFGRWELVPADMEEVARANGIAVLSDPQLPLAPPEFPLIDPMCGGYEALNTVAVLDRDPSQPTPEDLMDALGNGFSARWRERAAQSPDDALAISILSNSGVVIRPSRYELIDDVRAAVIEELQRGLARDRGIDPNIPNQFQPFLETTTALAIQKTVEELDPQALKFALERNYNAYRLLTDTGEEEDLWEFVDSGGGILFTPIRRAGVPVFDVFQTGQILADLEGLVVEGGLSRSDISVDVMARMGGAQVASQCSERGLNFDRNVMQTFQNVFSLGDFFRYKLRRLGETFEVLATPETSEEARLAKAGVTELGAWTAEGRVTAEFSQGTPPRLVVRLLGLTPQELGVTNEEEMLGAISLVYGEPWVADCATGARRSCPDDLSSTIVPPSAAPTVEATNNSGFEGAILRFEFDLSSVPMNEPGAQGAQHLYLMSERDTVPGKSTGRVLATLASRSGTHTEVISSYQRMRANEIFGISIPFKDTGTCTERTSIATPDKHCVGIPRNYFVPLANEISSTDGQSEDSWKHYLALAEDAAVKADQLGRELFDLGLQQDLRREAAQEELGQLCGGFVDAESIAPIGEQQITVSGSGGSEVEACVNPETVDLVFLGEDPFDGMDTAQIKAAYGCNNPGAQNEPFCRKETITSAGLGIVKGIGDFGGGDPADCGGVGAAYGTLTSPGGFDGDSLAALAQAQWIRPGNARSAMLGLRLNVQNTGDHWELTQSGRLIMAAYPDGAPVLGNPDDPGRHNWIRSVFPACLTPPAGWTCSDLETGAPIPCTCDLEPALTLKQVFTASGASQPTGVEVLHQLERAMWYLGGLGGRIPSGVFAVPLPVVNDFSTPQPYPAIYGGPLDDSLNAGQFRLVENAPRVTGEDRRSLPVAVEINPRFVASRLNTSNGAPLPTWLRELYQRANPPSAPGRYLQIRASNAEIELKDADELGDSNSQRVGFLASLLSGVGTQTHCGHFGPSGGSIENTFLDLVTNVAPRLRDWEGGAILRMRSVGRSGGRASPFLHVYQNPFLGGGSGPMDSAVLLNGLLVDVPEAPAGEVFTDFVPTEATWWPDGLTVAGANCSGVAPYDPAEFTGAYFPIDADHAPTSEERSPECLNATHLQNEGCLAWDPLTNCEPRTNYRLAVTIPGRGTVTGAHWLAQAALRPSAMPPNERVEMFLNQLVPADGCEMAKNLARTMALACVLDNGARSAAPPIGVPPPIRTLEDITELQHWIEDQRDNVNKAVVALHLRDVPQSVLDVFQLGTVDAGAVSQGNYGRMVLQVRDHLQDIHDQWIAAGEALGQVATAIKIARIGLESANIGERQELLGLAAQSFEIDREVAHRKAQDLRDAYDKAVGAVSALTSLATGNPFGFASSALGTLVEENADHMESRADYEYFDRMRRNIASQEELVQDATGLAVQGVLAELADATSAAYPNLNSTVSGIKTATSQALQVITEINTNQLAASLELAKVAGSDYATMDGEEVSMPVNVVLRRQYDITSRRYERALESAKRAAYIARLAIEQRIGVGLNDLAETIGPLPAPRTWADDVCSLSGINYRALAAPPTLGGNSEPTIQGSLIPEDELLTRFSDQYIGDYVDKLKEFVEFHNIEFPFRQADDMTVISVRDDLLNDRGACSKESRNLLYFSDALQSGTYTASVFRGWRLSSCTPLESSCLKVHSGDAMGPEGSPQLAPPGGDSGGVSWLHEVTATDDTRPLALNFQGAPANIVYQTIELKAGTPYLLSWWDTARGPDGAALSPSARNEYQVAVYTADWVPIAVRNESARGGTEWTDFRQLSFESVQAGDYRVAFSASFGTGNGSLAIANVQLEEPTASGAVDTRYEHTDGSRTVLSASCMQGSPEQFRAAFIHRCEADQCFFELDQPLYISTVLLNRGNSRLLGKLAAGNYNYRHSAVSLNLVGTGLIDCSDSPNPDCFGNSVVEFDLDHSAFDVPVLDYHNTARCFTYGTGAIRRGKALAAERFITVPTGSADLALLSETGIQKAELAGRPLDGSYRLRLVDRASFDFSKLQDVQLVLNYRYWSRIDRTN